MAPRGDLEDLAPGLARERTELAWSRTAIAFAAVGGGLLKTSVAAGLIVVAMSVLIWGLCRFFPAAPTTKARSGRLLLVAMTVTAVALVALAVALLGHGGAGPKADGHRQPDGARQLSLTAPLRADR